MSHPQLNRVLQECPESPYFNRDDFSTGEAPARNLVLAFVEMVHFGNLEPLPESSPSEEYSAASIMSEKKLQALIVVEQAAAQAISSNGKLPGPVNMSQI